MIFFVVAIYIHFKSFYNIVKEPNPSSPIKMMFLINILGFFMLPCISNDIFSVLNYGNHFDGSPKIYTQSTLNPSLFTSYVSGLYHSIPCVYGIGAMLVSKLSIQHTVIGSIFTFKGVALLCSIISGFFICRTPDLSPRQQWIWCLNPIWTIHALGHAHIEVLSISLFFISILLTLKEKYILSVLFFLLSFSTKFSLIFCLPILWMIPYLKGKQSLKLLSIHIAIYLVATGVLIGSEYIYWGQSYSILIPIKTVSSLWPTGSFAEIIFAIKKIITSSFHPEYGLEQTLSDRLFLEKLGVLLKGIFILFNLALIYRCRKQLIANLPLILFSGVASLLFIYSHRFMSWYLLLFIPFFVLPFEWKKIIFIVMILGFFATIQDAAHFNHIQPLSTIILAIAIPATIITQLWLLKQIFYEGRNINRDSK